MNSQKKSRKRKILKAIFGAMVCAVMTATVCLSVTGCGGGGTGNTGGEKVIIYSNADDEAVECIEKTLNENGYQGQYVIQSFGTSELGGKLLAEGEAIEADVVTMSSYYIESAQNQSRMFRELTVDAEALQNYPSYYMPFLANQGTILVNTEVLADSNLATPDSLADLADPQYAGNLSVVDIQGSSTAWLMIQALISEYGEDGAQEILSAIYANAGAHLEQSGSGPIKKVRAGEVALGFGLRHQAVADKKDGLPVDYVDPAEGTFTLTESLAVVDKGENTNPLAMEMVECIIEEGRDDLMEYYPVTLYKDEAADSVNAVESKVFSEPLTVELLEKHRALSENSK